MLFFFYCILFIPDVDILFSPIRVESGRKINRDDVLSSCCIFPKGILQFYILYLTLVLLKGEVDLVYISDPPPQSQKSYLKKSSNRVYPLTPYKCWLYFIIKKKIKKMLYIKSRKNSLTFNGVYFLNALL